METLYLYVASSWLLVAKLQTRSLFVNGNTLSLCC